ncbi:MAG: translation elongation factor Ts [Chloroflexi bacterium]|nr:translation elongation factor Ts [Chloroflexota bacterium]
MKITMQMVKDLREATSAGIMDAKKALEATNGDVDAAIEILKKKGAERAAERSDRAAKEGLVEMYAHPGNRVGVMLEINSETDFVARNENFRALAHDLALHIAAMSPRYVSIEDIPQADLDKQMGEMREKALEEGKPEAIVEKIVAGRMKKFYEGTCLMEQPFVKDDEITIREIVTEAIRTTGENIIVRRFARYELGEEL